MRVHCRGEAVTQRWVRLQISGAKEEAPGPLDLCSSFGSLSLIQGSPGRRWRRWQVVFERKEKCWAANATNQQLGKGVLGNGYQCKIVATRSIVADAEQVLAGSQKSTFYIQPLEGGRRIFELSGGILDWLGGGISEWLNRRGCVCSPVQGTLARLQENHCIHAQGMVAL